MKAIHVSGGGKFWITSGKKALLKSPFGKKMTTELAVKPEFSPHLFWDRDPAQLDYRKQAAFIIERAFEFGKLDDLAEATAYYGTAQVVEVLTAAPALKKNTLALASVLFDIPKTRFKCYISPPSPLNSLR